MKYKITYINIVGSDAGLTKYKYFDNKTQAIKWSYENYYAKILEFKQVAEGENKK